MSLLQKLLKSPLPLTPSPVAQKPQLNEVKDTLSFLILKCSVMDGMLQAIQNVTGCDRPEASQKAMGVDWDEVTYITYCDLLQVMTLAEIEYVGGLQYDPLAVKYRKELPDVIMKQQSTYAGIIALCCAERSDIIQ